MLIAGLGVLSGLAGGFCGALLLADRATPPSPPTERSSDSELVAPLRDLANEVRLIHESIEAGAASRAAGPASERAPVGTSSTERLENAIERLAEVLASPATAAQPRKTDGSRSRKALVPKATDRLLALCAMTEEERGRNYYFWNRQDFLDQFGAPDEVGVQGDGGYNVVLVYKIGDERTLQFAFANELLYYIDCQD